MQGIYPLRPVVCDEPHWKAVYDSHPGSIQIASACVSTSEAQGLLADGARFEAIVLLNGAGEGLLEKLQVRLAGEAAADIPVERVHVDHTWPGGVECIHDFLSDRRLTEFLEGGG